MIDDLERLSKILKDKADVTQRDQERKAAWADGYVSGIHEARNLIDGIIMRLNNPKTEGEEQ